VLPSGRCVTTAVVLVLALRNGLRNIRKGDDKAAFGLLFKNDRIIKHGSFSFQAKLFLDAFDRRADSCPSAALRKIGAVTGVKAISI
jgi:hypothetical protein